MNVLLATAKDSGDDWPTVVEVVAFLIFMAVIFR